MSKVKLLLNVAQDMRSLAESIQAVADAMAQNEPEFKAEKPDIAPPVKEVKLEEVRAVLAQKSRDGCTDKIRELLLKYGSDRLSRIDPMNYPALLKDAEELTNAK